MASRPDIFDHSADFDPAGDLALFLGQIPAKWVVYLFTDADDQPIQLLCVKNLRASLKRRLGGQEIIGPSRKVNYRDLVRRIYWRRVDSGFEADLAYLEAAREIFPRSYRGMLGFEPAWFAHVNPDNNFPRWAKTIDLSKPGLLIGPLQDKHAAQKLIELIEDAFDLCRYYNVLIEAPHGRACAYKEMGKCPAPCDGTISMAQYREMIRWGAAVAVSPSELIAQTRHRLEEAARDLNFEAAGKIKQYLDQLSQFRKGALRYTRRIEDFRYLSLQPGGRPGTAKLFLITPGQIEEIACLIAEPIRCSDLLRFILARAAQAGIDATEQGTERIGIVSDHLFRAKRISGVFLHMDDLDDRALVKAFKELQKQKGQSPEQDDEDEGVVKELQQI